MQCAVLHINKNDVELINSYIRLVTLRDPEFICMYYKGGKRKYLDGNQEE